MKEQKIMRITMLGEFQIQCGDILITDQNSRSKKPWNLLEYLITFREKELSQYDLIEMLWPEEDSNNPAGALKTLLHRVRKILDPIKVIGTEELIVQRRGTYSWNNAINFRVDIDDFEKSYKKALSLNTSDPERLKLLLQTIHMYKGDFLPKSSSEAWVVPINTYYHSLYLEIVHAAISQLEEQHDYNQICDICRTAINIDPYDEQLYYRFISALYESGNQHAAIQQYEYSTDLFLHKLGITPSNELKALYRKIIKTSKRLETDLGAIEAGLKELGAVNGAFYCEYEFFKDIYQLKVRAAQRSADTLYLCLITVANSIGNVPELNRLTPIMEELKRTINRSLRRGDVFTGYSISQYILLLSSINYENGNKVLNRIVQQFNAETKRKNINLTYKLKEVSLY